MFKYHKDETPKIEQQIYEKNIIKLDFLEDLEKEFIQENKKLKTEIFLSDNLFIVEELTYFDEEQYNIFDYIVEFHSGYFFAISREVIDEIIIKMKTQNIYLVGIFLFYENIKEIEKINFLSIEQRKEFIKEEINYFKYAIIIAFSLIIYLFFKSYNHRLKIEINGIERENSLLKDKIKEKQNIILSIENTIEEEKKFNQSLIERDTSVSEILNKISSETIEDFFIDSLTITKNQIGVIGSSRSLDTIYKFKRKLFNDGFEKINNDFIKNEAGNIIYKIDFYYNYISKIERNEEND